MQVLVPAIRNGKTAPRKIDVDLFDDGFSLPVMTITEGKKSYSYSVEEFLPDAGFDGRAFRLSEIDSPDTYNCFVCRNGQDQLCDCLGFEHRGYCKHLPALASLIADGLLPEPCSDRQPEAWPVSEFLTEEEIYWARQDVEQWHEDCADYRQSR